MRSGMTQTNESPEFPGRFNPYTIFYTEGGVDLSGKGEEVVDEGDVDVSGKGEEVVDEGAVQRVLLDRYERSRRNRRAAIGKHGVRCFGCRIEMAEVYGRIAKGRIHIHHVKPLSTMRGVRPDIEDLVPLCPNCHTIVHLEVPPLSINKLKELIYQQQMNIDKGNKIG